MRGTVTRRRTREQGTSKDRWQPEENLCSSILGTAPVPSGVASGQIHQNVHHVGTLLPQSIRKFGTAISYTVR